MVTLTQPAIDRDAQEENTQEKINLRDRASKERKQLSQSAMADGKAFSLVMPTAVSLVFPGGWTCIYSALTVPERTILAPTSSASIGIVIATGNFS